MIDTNIKLRLENVSDYREVEELTREAFFGIMSPRCDEHYLAHELRKSGAFIKELDYVAVDNGKIVGNIMYTKSKVVSEDGIEHEMIIFGPLSVLPEYQSKCIGAMLVRHTLEKAKELGYRAVFIFGHSDYYPKFGFVNAKQYNITTDEGENFDAFMALPLYKGALDGISGKFYFDDIYNVDSKAAAEFDNSFPEREAIEPAPVDALMNELSNSARETLMAKQITTIPMLITFSSKEIAAWGGIGKDDLKAIQSALKKQRNRLL